MKNISAFRRKGLLTWTLVILSAFFLTSCINIEEYYHFNRDGSGRMWIKMDVSDMMAMMGGLMAEMDSTDGLNEDELFEDMETIDALNAVPGISNVKSLNDKEEGIIGYSYYFNSISALNNSLGIVNEDVSALTDAAGSGSSQSRQFQYDGKKLVVIKPETEPAKEDDEDEELDESMMEMMKEYMKSYTYKTTYSFEQRVKKAKNKRMTIGFDKKSVVIEENMADLMEEGVKMDGVIKLKK